MKSETKVNENECDDEKIVEFKKWLTNTVKLPQYMSNFAKHNLMDLEIVEMMQQDNLSAIGIGKVGDSLRFLKHIANLKRKSNLK